MKDALPQHDIDGIAARLKSGVLLADIRRHRSDVDPAWFDRNEASLYKLAGIDPPSGTQTTLDDVLDAPEPTEDDIQAEVEREPEARGKKHKR